MDKQDYYDILNVKKDATLQEIKKAYRKLAREYHPDHNKEEGAEKKFREVQESYEVLSDESKRKAYDQYGHAGTEGFFSGGDSQQYGSGESHFDMGDIFNQFFSGGGDFGFDFGGGRRSQKETRGSDLHYKVKIDFLESMEEQDISIDILRNILCSTCSGTGSSTGKLKKCSTCGGSGKVRKVQNSFLGRVAIVTDCSDCKGQGETPEKICSECRGIGVKNEKEKFKLKIPAGAYDGMVLRFGGGGNVISKGNPGDLYIELEITPHEFFERRGDDIHSKISIDVPTAVLGGVVEVETVLDKEKLKIPAGTQSGTIFRIRRKGSPVVGHPSRRGDHYVKVKVEIPEKLDRDERKIYEMLKK